MTAVPSIDPRAEAQRLFRQVMGRFATGVTVVTTRLGDETFGMTANAFMAGSLEPMLCVVSINHTALMHSRLEQAGHFGVSFLSQEQQHLAAHFGGKRLERLVPDFELRGRTPILERAVAAVTADVVSTAACGDHTLFVGSINSLDFAEASRPLLFYGGRYARLDSRASLGSTRSVAAVDGAPPPEFW
ncbi:MAG TPA: flavin reductase family protein [Gammaproteobacteria bacterium]|nr:flavin reductase family protein [Gammaproteobacteria bacterium]